MPQLYLVEMILTPMHSQAYWYNASLVASQNLAAAAYLDEKFLKGITSHSQCDIVVLDRVPKRFCPIGLMLD